MSTSSAAWLCFIRDNRWSAKQKRLLIDKFEQAHQVYAQDKASITALLGASKKPPSRINKAHINKAQLDADMAWLAQANHHLIDYHHPDYPEQLKQLSDPPIALFAIGDVSLLSQASVAIVGSRRPTPVGAQCAESLARDLANLGVVINSGMALGVDSLAHRGALQAKGGTVAVLGCGVDCIYPTKHRNLYEQIAEQGCLLSEYPLGSCATRYSFPQRNRIISGLSLGVIIVEAAQKSGTLITARLAMEQDREVMVVPGSALSRQYQGSHRLIQQGAALVVDKTDVLQALQIELNASLDASLNESSQEPTHPLLNHIGSESTSIDQIISSSGLTAAQVSAMLLTLEMQGQIASTQDGGYVSLG